MFNSLNCMMFIICILQVEDSEFDVELVLGEFDVDGIVYDVQLVDDEVFYFRVLEEFQLDIVLFDLSLLGFFGQCVLELLCVCDIDILFIFVFVMLGEEVVIEVLCNGVIDYIFKQNLVCLVSVVCCVLSEVELQWVVCCVELELICVQCFEVLVMLVGGFSYDLCNLLQFLLLVGDSLQDYQDDLCLVWFGVLVCDCGKCGLEMVQLMLFFVCGVCCVEQVWLGGLMEVLDLLLQGLMLCLIVMEVVLEDLDVVFEGNYIELQQCLFNLCFNVIQVMFDGGYLCISFLCCCLLFDFFLFGEEVQDGEYFCFIVVDIGEGMDDEMFEWLFELFFIIKKIGIGLGLFLCKCIVVSYGGVMCVESNCGEGMWFFLYILLIELCEDVVSVEFGNDNFEGNVEQVLVVVEEVVQLLLLLDMFDVYGYQVYGSQSGIVVLQWIEVQGVFDVVVMDVEMNLFIGVCILVVLVDYGYDGLVLLLVCLEVLLWLDELLLFEWLYVVDKLIIIKLLLCVLCKVFGNGKVV